MSGSIEAEIGYIAPMTEQPLSYSGYPDQEKLVLEPRTMRIADAGKADVAYATHGFAAVPHRSGIKAFDRTDSWHDAFKAEVADLIKDVTGAREVVIPGASYRSTAFSGSFGAAHFCHNDYTAGSTAIHIHNLDPARSERRLSGRYAAIQVWKLVSEGPQDQPLAMCSAPSVSAADIVPGVAWYGDPAEKMRWGEMACIRHNPRHEWYYYPELTSDEIIIWAGYDSDPSQPSLVPHTAIIDPTVAGKANARINVEARCYAFF